MKVAVEIWNGCVQSVYADQPCEVAIVDRDELAEETLPDGERGYASIWEATVNTGTVRDAFSLASLHHAGGIAGALLRAIQRMRRRRDP